METVLVKGWAKDGSHDAGVLINKSDFNPEIHELFGAAKKVVQENELLKRKAEEVIEDLPALSIEELQAWRSNEESGKARQGVLAAIEKELASRVAE